MSRRRVAVVAALLVAGVCAAASLLSPALARADGDPASDALIEQNVFYPYSSPVPQSAQDRLNAAVARAHRGGLDLKVAIIARASDLGSITQLYGAPQRYAEFLDDELSLGTKIPLLIVMPSGFGVQGLSPAGDRAVASASPPHGGTGADLAQAAQSAVAALLKGATHPAGDASGVRDTDTGRIILLLGLVLAAVLIAGAIVVLRVFFPPTRP